MMFIFGGLRQKAPNPPYLFYKKTQIDLLKTLADYFYFFQAQIPRQARDDKPCYKEKKTS